jgi:ABC-2 type transport system permease protein
VSIRAVARIARADLAGYRRDRTVGVLLGSVLALSLLSLAVAAVDHVETRRDKEAAQRLARDAWVTQGEKNPHGAGHFGTFVFKPLQPLAILDRGLDSYLGQRVRIETHSQHEATGRPVEDASSLRRFGQLTPAFLLLYLGPLLMLLVTFQAVSREREQGTLPMLLAQGVGAGTLFRGKALAAAAVVPVLAAPLAAVVFVAPLAGVLVNADLLARLAVMALAFVAYLTAFALLGIGVSGWVRSSTVSLVVLLALWTCAATVAPRLAVLLAEWRHPTPSSVGFLSGYDDAMGNRFVYGYGGFDTFNTTYARIQRDLLKQYGVADAKALPVNPFGFALEATEQEGQRAYDRTFGTVARAFERQTAVHRAAAPASPFMGARFLFMGLAGTGLEEHLNFLAQAEQYRRRMMNTLNMDIAHHSLDPTYDVKVRNSTEYLRGVELWSSIPDFDYVPLPIDAVLRTHARDLAALLGWNLAAAIVAWTGVRHACRTP